MSRRPSRAPPPATPLDTLLYALGADTPDVAQRQALKAVIRGDASPGQQRTAMTYVLGELCGVARNTFTTDTHASAFRQGAQGVGQALAAIAEMTVLSSLRASETPYGPPRPE